MPDADPWRYRCPDCGSTNLELIPGCERPEGKRYVANGRGAKQAQQDREENYRCRRCEQRLSHVRDALTDSLVQPERV